MQPSLLKPDFAKQDSQEVGADDLRRGLTIFVVDARGANHRTREATTDTGREQKAQVGSSSAFAITGSTGLRRRERRFESCRGHHL